MSTFLPPASVRIRPVSSDSRKELLRNLLMAKIPILTRVNVSSVVDALNLLCRQKMQQTLRLAPLTLLKLGRILTVLELTPVSRNSVYQRPIVISHLYYTCVRNDAGAITEVISILV